MLMDKVERDHRQTDAEFLRRRIVVAATLVVGATLLGLSFSTAPGEPAFYPLTIGLAATWAIGGLAPVRCTSGRIEFRGELRRPIVTPIVVGLLLAAVFVVGAWSSGGAAPRRPDRGRDRLRPLRASCPSWS